jgi:hypothetical protein
MPQNHRLGTYSVLHREILQNGEVHDGEAVMDWMPRSRKGDYDYLCGDDLHLEKP